MTSKADATTVVSGSDGSFKVIGLTNGDYVLNETKAPSSDYVLLKDGTITFTVEHGKYGSAVLEVKNTQKGLLPSTGGAGILGYLALGLLMIMVSVLWYRKNGKIA